MVKVIKFILKWHWIYHSISIPILVHILHYIFLQIFTNNFLFIYQLFYTLIFSQYWYVSQYYTITKFFSWCTTNAPLQKLYLTHHFCLIGGILGLQTNRNGEWDTIFGVGHLLYIMRKISVMVSSYSLILLKRF